MHAIVVHIGRLKEDLAQRTTVSSGFFGSGGVGRGGSHFLVQSVLRPFGKGGGLGFPPPRSGLPLVPNDNFLFLGVQPFFWFVFEHQGFVKTRATLSPIPLRVRKNHKCTID